MNYHPEIGHIQSSLSPKPKGVVIETLRLNLRQLTLEDLDEMYAYLGDAQTMRHYPAPFSRDFVRQGIERNLKAYKLHGYGLFGVILGSTGDLIGDCGLIWQEVDGGTELEVGYHFNRQYWSHGYATEAAKACMEWAFANAGVDHVISLIRPENLPSRRVAERNGMQAVRQIMWKELLHDVWRKDRQS